MYDQRILPLTKIVPNDWNPQEMSEEQFDRLVQSVKEDGFLDSISVVELDDDTFRIIGGEHRWRAAKEVGLKEIPALVVPLEDWDEDRQKFETVRLNAIKGQPNAERFRDLYEDLADRYPKDVMQNLMGYTDRQAFAKLIGDVQKSVKSSVPEEYHDRFDEQAKDAETVEDLDRILRDLFNRYGSTLDHSFMVFSHGNQQHLYITMNEEMQSAMERVMDYCLVSGKDLNEVMAPITFRWLEEVEEEFEDAERDVAEDETAF